MYTIVRPVHSRAGLGLTLGRVADNTARWRSVTSGKSSGPSGLARFREVMTSVPHATVAGEAPSLAWRADQEERCRRTDRRADRTRVNRRTRGKAVNRRTPTVNRATRTANK